MKTLKKLSSEEKRIFQAKSAIAFNKNILDDILAFVFNKITDIDTLEKVYDELESILENLDCKISKTIKLNENNNKANSN